MITIQLTDPDSKYSPGEPIRGTVRWSSPESKPDSIDIRLIWFTRGKGNRDVEVVGNSAFEPSGESGEHEFEFQAPEHPYSFSGKLISLVWAIEAISFPENEAEQAELTIAPRGVEVILSSENPS